MELKLAFFGDAVLRKKVAPVTKFDDELKELVLAMYEIMRQRNGIGLAAPQVYKSIALFISSTPIKNDKGFDQGELKVFINPKILSVSSEKEIGEEGCLSIPGIYGDVLRPIKIKISAFDLYGKEFIQELEGLNARCFLHENDHLNGVMFIDRMSKKEKKQHENDLRKLRKCDEIN